MLRFLAAASLALFTLIASSALADNHDNDRIKQLALDAILENPEIIAEAITILRDRDEEKRLSDMRSKIDQYRGQLENDPNAPVLGNVDGDMIIVEFFDYNCPYCKSVAPDVLKLITDDQNIRLVYREWPILGEDSVFAARAALAAREQGKYEEFHWSLMSLRRANEESVLQAAAELGMDIDKLQRDMMADEVNAHIQLSMQMASAIGFTGTPSFVMGDQIVPGAISLEEMQRIVENSRQSRPTAE
jgi:protein-disulfide isomerase